MTTNAITLFCFWHLFPSTITSTGKGGNSSYWKPRKLWSRDGQLKVSVDGQLMLLMEEILHHLGCIESCKYWDKLAIHWCRISSINSSIFPEALKLGSTATTSLRAPFLSGAMTRVVYQRNGVWWKFSWVAGSKGEMSVNGLLQQKSTKRFLRKNTVFSTNLTSTIQQNHNPWKTTTTTTTTTTETPKHRNLKSPLLLMHFKKATTSQKVPWRSLRSGMAHFGRAAYHIGGVSASPPLAPGRRRFHQVPMARESCAIKKPVDLTIDSSEIRNKNHFIGTLSPFFTGFYRSPDFWTNSMT